MDIQIIREVLEAWLGASIKPVVLDPLAESIAASLAEGAPVFLADQ